MISILSRIIANKIKQPRERDYNYSYESFALAWTQYFTIRATSQELADREAEKVWNIMVKHGETMFPNSVERSRHLFFIDYI